MHSVSPSALYCNSGNDIASELANAQRLAAHARIVPMLAAMGPRTDRAPWGFAFIQPRGDRYAPDPDGEPAFIVAAEDGPRLRDLVACTLEGRRTYTRLGVAAILGDVWLQRALAYKSPLFAHSDPLAWLHRGQVGVVIVDWRVGCHLLRFVSSLVCDREELATRIRDTMAALSVCPELRFVRPRRD